MPAKGIAMFEVAYEFDLGYAQRGSPTFPGVIVKVSCPGVLIGIL
jgi:hypothetical protein